ncbi:ATP-dependent RNA helicase rok1 [Talaromyces proteolyticus]|uniref:ATP-dependent RNA helicase ROK1 n=1 Tax=Talaromyces proteolyticus TaxID=1131652 RepID=A0AAD4KY37_9EURO|nr:ATP-dependent RNA helicase rok1 [Talaromyces proteolyticus]KAH8698646.1 ATP-dependent RNA helicase rok1 [Talaromyces proteolyticus]
MDAFKLLTRSTKLKPTAASSNSHRLPSAGKAENPQLFRSAQDLETKKRKRGSDEHEDSDGNEGSDNEFDATQLALFGAKSAPVKNASLKESKKLRKSNKNQSVEEDNAQNEPDSDHEVSTAVMEESERRSILKAHRIKVSDLRDLEEIQAAKTGDDVEKKKKRKKKKEPTLSKKKQKEARQLYPEPLVSFQELRNKYRVSRRLTANIGEQGFSVPTEVQMGSLPLLLWNSAIDKTPSSPKESQELDLLVVAPTGSGKTLAFLIPLINNMVQHHRQNPGQREICSVIVAPTKELVGQIVNEGRKLAVGTGVTITAMRKGMQVMDLIHDEENLLEEKSSSESDPGSSSDNETEDAKSKSKGKKTNTTVTKSDILVTTPLALVNALSANKTKSVSPLPSVEHLVLDEADVLLDPLFREQTSAIWNACTNPRLRISLWSATMGSNIEELTKETIKKRRESLAIENSQNTSTPLLRVVIGLKDSAVPNIKHKLVYAATEQGKLLGLRQLLRPSAAVAPNEARLRPPFLIFTQTIPRAVALHSELLYDIPPEAGGSSRIAVLHSDLSETRRSDIMKGFRKGEIWIIITTDLLARGVDFRGINGVVNYDIPTSSAAYVHRVGRTGRAGREGGVAVTFYTKEDIPYVKSIANLIHTSEKLQGTTGEKSVQKWLLDALPDLSKKDKQELKRHGVKARAASAKLRPDGKEIRTSRISTKSGYDRKMENKRKGTITANRQKSKASTVPAESGDEWEGIDE